MKHQLYRINGFGQVKVKRYGQQITTVIKKYCEENSVTTQLDQRPRLKQPKKDNGGISETHRDTLRYFKEGMKIEDIASYRKLTPGTIESHLARLIQFGEIKITEVMDQKLVDLIIPVLEQHQDKGLKPIKESLPREISYGHIRMVIGHVENLKTKTQKDLSGR